MILKDRKVSALKKGLKFFIAAELFMFTGCYFIYGACNRSQETRKYFRDSPYFGFVLEYYYQVGERFGTGAVRIYDQAVWGAEKGVLPKSK